MAEQERAGTLERRVREIGLALTAQALPADATITPRALALAERDAAGMAPTLAQGEVATVPEAGLARDLPHISLAQRAARSESNAGTGSGVASAPRSLESGRRADLELHELLGEGGMGRVHAARQRSLDRDVAVKTARDASSAAAVESLLREARIMGSLEHPAIIPVHALGLDDARRPLIVMKRVEGVEWTRLLEDPHEPRWQALAGSGRDRLAANLEILMQVCRAAHFAHSRGVLHRDIKPDNVMIGEFGEIYLGDWGIAVPAADVATPNPRRALIGTPAYMAPEMAVGGPLDARTDVYLIGATLHQVLTGRFRHDGASLEAVLVAALESRPFDYDATVPEELARLCARACAVDPAARFESARAVEQAIAEFLLHRSAVALSAAAEPRLEELAARMAAAPPGGVPDDLPSLHRLATEARFGFTESLRQWPENPAGLAGRRRVLELLVDLELRQENASGARALLAELGESGVALGHRVDELEARLASRRSEEERLRAFAHELDPSVSAAQRTRTLYLLVVFTVALSAWAQLGPGGESRLTSLHAVIFGAIVLVASLGAVAIWRRALLSNAFNRRLVGSLFVVLLALVAERVAGLIEGWPVSRTLTQNLLLFALAMAMLAATLVPRFFVGAGLLVAGWIWALAVPAQAMTAFTLSTSLNVLAVIWALRSMVGAERSAG
jgi:eukaryotic-like serine/threonine-protein kinase